MSSVFYYEPFYDFDRFFEESLSGNRHNPRGGNQVQQRNVDGAVRSFKRPRMDLHEDPEKNIVTATFEFPGVSKENVQIETHNGKLIISAETKVSSEHDENGYAVRERRFGKLSRALQLPQGVKDDEITASMEHGVLTVTFPKAAAQAAPKKISIS